MLLGMTRVPSQKPKTILRRIATWIVLVFLGLHVFAKVVI